jgi:hypothetical protein
LGGGIPNCTENANAPGLAHRYDNVPAMGEGEDWHVDTQLFGKFCLHVIDPVLVRWWMPEHHDTSVVFYFVVSKKIRNVVGVQIVMVF